MSDQFTILLDIYVEQRRKWLKKDIKYFCRFKKSCIYDYFSLTCLMHVFGRPSGTGTGHVLALLRSDTSHQTINKWDGLDQDLCPDALKGKVPVENFQLACCRCRKKMNAE